MKKLSDHAALVREAETWIRRGLSPTLAIRKVRTRAQELDADAVYNAVRRDIFEKLTTDDHPPISEIGLKLVEDSAPFGTSDGGATNLRRATSRWGEGLILGDDQPVLEFVLGELYTIRRPMEGTSYRAGDFLGTGGKVTAEFIVTQNKRTAFASIALYHGGASEEFTDLFEWKLPKFATAENLLDHLRFLGCGLSTVTLEEARRSLEPDETFELGWHPDNTDNPITWSPW